jgi:hypothetical protein
MPVHKFLIGQKVVFQPELGQVANRGEVFIVIRQLPESDGAFQYQIKSEMDAPYGTRKETRGFIAGPMQSKRQH